MTSRNELADHIQSLNPDEFRELQDVSNYLGDRAGKGNPTGFMHEGSVASLLNRQSPKVRQAFHMLNEVVETPREAPFAAKLSEAELFDKIGLDADAGTTIKGVLDAQYVAGTLQERMGTDSDREPEPPSTRDILSAAYDASTGAE